MPVFKAGEGQAPAWSELEMFEIINLKPGEERKIALRGPKEKYVLLEGDVSITSDGGRVEPALHSVIDVQGLAALSSKAGGSVMRLCGNWGEELGGSGVFPVFLSSDPQNWGDPADYPRNTNFDNHYHDCDEYWILYKGSGRAVSEGVVYEVEAGDCVATGREHHHDFPWVYEPVSAVYLETTLVGKKRLGHMWEHAHAKAEPDAGRV